MHVYATEKTELQKLHSAFRFSFTIYTVDLHISETMQH